MTNPAAPSDLAIKRDAQVVVRPAPTRAAVRSHRATVARRPVRGQHVQTLIGTEKSISRELSRLSRTGVLVDTGVRRVVQSGQHAGRLELRVIVKDAHVTPRWAKVCLGAGLILAPLALAAAMVLWIAATLSAASIIGGALVAVVLLALLTRAGGPSRKTGVTVVTTTSVHMR